MKLAPFTPHDPQSFWCNNCDANVVDSTKPGTGSFHIQFGHAWNAATKSFDGDGEYLGVMFAFCARCAGAECSEEETRI